MESLDAVLRQNRVLATGAAAVAIAGLAAAYSNYRAYVALGDHGLPGDFSGWWKQLKWQLIARTDTRKPAPYRESELDAEIYGAASRRSHYSPPAYPRAKQGSSALSQRAGSRPTVPGFVAPQRQTTQVPGPGIKDRQDAYLEALGAANPAIFDVKTSGIEKVGTALWVRGGGDAKEGLPPILKRLGGEFAHVHPEGSTHVVLSLPDAEAVIAAGWGERHKLTGPMIPWGYTLVYGPRDEAEFAVWESLVQAGARYFVGEGVELKLPE